MSAAARPVGSADRMGVTLLFSVIAHGVLALGLTFEYQKPAPSLPALDVILVQSASGQKPQKADYLAQAANTGGGESEKRLRPSSTVSSPVSKPEQGIAPRPIEAGAPRPQLPTEKELLTTQEKSTFAVTTQKETPEQPALPLPTNRDLTEKRLEMARLAEEVQRENQAYAKRPRIKYISANTKEYEYAAYMAGWVARIERIGNLNYPDDARRQQLHGQVILAVQVNRDGTIGSIDVVQSSGHKLLDDAAVRIAHLAAPFPAIPDKEGYDKLNITRTWQFLPGDILRNTE